MGDTLMIKWKLWLYAGYDLREVKVKGETKRFVILEDGKREAKTLKGLWVYFDTEIDAWQWIRDESDRQEFAYMAMADIEKKRKEKCDSILSRLRSNPL